MEAPRALHRLLELAATRWPDHVAVAEVDGARIGFRDLAALADALAGALRRMGVRPGDRVAIQLRKSIDAVAAIFGVLKIGAAYVPLDVEAPVSRNAFIVADAAASALIVERKGRHELAREIELLGATPVVLELADVGGGDHLRAALTSGDRPGGTPDAAVAPDDLAYVLYTSGSTGRPKGVMLSHRAALAFIGWCSETLPVRDTDRFASHAPFHFDLSILDLYVPMRHGARLLLIPDSLGKDPLRLAATLAAEQVSVWYSVPSVLMLLAQYGRLERHDLGRLRLVLFAGEVFPVKHLRRLVSLLPHARYFNLYGPTETNVCTFHEVPTEIPPERAEPFPIGRTCSHLRTAVVDEAGHPVPRGAEGELCVTGPAVMSGYCNLPELTARAFIHDLDGCRWYRTGDLVQEDAAGDYLFRGRRDRMVKRRGYRVELGEVEAGLLRHPGVREAVVIALPDGDGGVRIAAVMSWGADPQPTIIELKRFCAGVLPPYMVPDLFASRATLPRTGNGKVDLQRLADELGRPVRPEGGSAG